MISSNNAFFAKLYRPRFKNDPISRAAIILMHGVSGSGKSYVARQLADLLGAIRIRSDVERKRIFQESPAEPQEARVKIEMYSAHANRETYQRLQRLVRGIVEPGFPVIVDATFLTRRDRHEFAALARELSVPFIVVDCTAPVDVLRERLLKRKSLGRDASDADIKVLEIQLAAAEPIDSAEQETFCLSIPHRTISILP